MEPLKGNQLMELAFPKMSYQNLLESQKDVIQNQIENLLDVVAFQCKLTGVNPLSQEMAAGALSIKIGKKPRDLLNPKAVKYMQFVFSIKDAISKRETREISARFGVTVTQVRDFFAGQRSRVRKFVRMSREKTDKSAASDARPDEMASTSDPSMPAEPVPLDTVAPLQVEEGPSCSMRHEVPPGMEESDIYFTENIFRLMRKEESFAGQVKLLQWILRMENPSVTTWFLNEGGVILLATWLSEAATEEQTSVLRLILDVLCHLPLKKASSVHMSAVLQSVNRLRFYRTPDVANRSIILIAQWTKLFQKIQASKKSKSAGEAQDEMLLKQSIQEVMGNESLELRDDNSREALRLLCENPNYPRKLDTAPPLKLLTASGDDSHKRRGVLSSYTRERRKVQMVEQPGQRLAVRNPQFAKSTPTTQSRPLSADDIQKAKMRAQFMHCKHGKAIAGSDVQIKPESQNIGTSLQASVSPSVSKSHVRPQIEELRKADKALPEVANPKETIDLEEPPWKKYKRIQIPWRAPPEVKIIDEWSVGTGANSKEVEIQRNRIRRERETIYRSIQEIPSNPREPWDHEMDYDDTLTPKIPIEQLPDVEPFETPANSDNHSNQQFAAIASTSSSSSMPEPDLELLAELLKNPDLVFALAPKEGGDLSSHDTVKMLDMIKTYGVDGLSNLAGLKQYEDNKVEVSLPSPTPSSDVVANGQKPDFSRNPFSRQHAMPNGNAYRAPEVALSIGSPASTSVARQPSPAVQHWAPHTVVQSVASQQTSIQLPDQWHTPSNPLIHHQNHNSVNSQNLTPEFMINANNVVNFSRAPSNIISAASPTIWTDPLSNVKQSPLGRTYAPPQLAPQYPYSQEPTVSNTFRGRQSYEQNYQYQNNSNLNNYNGYARGPVQGAVPAGNRDGRTRNNLTEGPGFESWSPDNSPSRRHEYYQEPGVNFRQGYGPEWGSDPHHSGYQDNGRGGAGNKRWRDQRR